PVSQPVCRQCWCSAVARGACVFSLLCVLSVSQPVIAGSVGVPAVVRGACVFSLLCVLSVSQPVIAGGAAVPSLRAGPVCFRCCASWRSARPSLPAAPLFRRCARGLCVFVAVCPVCRSQPACHCRQRRCSVVAQRSAYFPKQDTGCFCCTDTRNLQYAD